MKRISIIAAVLGLTAVIPAHAWEYTRGRTAVKVTGSGTLGALVARDANHDVANAADFDIAAQLNYAVKRGWSSGVRLTSDYLAVDTKHYVKDAFAFLESPLGRIEIGQTDSIATKLGIGLPDVGGLRLNDYTILYDDIRPSGAIISNPTINGTRYNFRVNMVTVPTRPWQYGLSLSPYAATYKYAADFAAKYRHPHGKTKVAVSLGASFIDAPDRMAADVYAPRVTADWRAQVSGGISVQYNSWNMAVSARGIYDRNPVGVASDGLSAGTAVSYDILKFTASASYIISYTGLWQDTPNDINHAAVLSGRYKMNEWLDFWISGGAVGTDHYHPFISGGLRGHF